MKSRLWIAGVASLALLALAVITFSHENDSISLLQAIAIPAGEEPTAPLQLVYLPPSALAQTGGVGVAGGQEVFAAAPPVGGGVPRYVVSYQPAPVRYSYLPQQVGQVGSPLVALAAPPNARYVQVVGNNEFLQQQQPQQQQQQQAVPSKAAIMSTRQKEIMELRKALNHAMDKEEKYEKKVSQYRKVATKAQTQASHAVAEVQKAKSLRNWAEMEKSAAARLRRVQKMAELRAAKQKVVIDRLLPKVRHDVTRRRVLEKRLARAGLQARYSTYMEELARSKLMQDMQIAAYYSRNAQAASMAAKELSARALDVQKQAKEDRKTAVLDIKEARASVVGARQSAEKTLTAIRAAMKQGAGGQTQEANFARDARLATKEMSSKKRDAKALREEATRLDAEAKTLTLEAAERAQVVPSYLAKAAAANKKAAIIRNQLKTAVETALPLSLSVARGEQLAQISSQKKGGEIQQLAAWEHAYSESAALLQKVKHVTEEETTKADRDAQIAEDRFAKAKARLESAARREKIFGGKIRQLTPILRDAKQQLSELETEAKDIAGSA